MTGNQKNILILCTGNSARSIIGEALINRLGTDRYQGFSAGSTPAGRVNPFALQLLAEKGYVTGGYRSKSWGEFAGPGAPNIDFVITVCDNAAGEVCPIWPGHPMTAHWGIPDPAAVQGSDEEVALAFATAYDKLEARITAFMDMDIDHMAPDEVKSKLKEIGQLD